VLILWWWYIILTLLSTVRSLEFCFPCRKHVGMGPRDMLCGVVFLSFVYPRQLYILLHSLVLLRAHLLYFRFRQRKALVALVNRTDLFPCVLFVCVCIQYGIKKRDSEANVSSLSTTRDDGRKKLSSADLTGELQATQDACRGFTDCIQRLDKQWQIDWKYRIGKWRTKEIARHDSNLWCLQPSALHSSLCSNLCCWNICTPTI